MNVGILGAGNISATHLRAARSLPGVKIVAVCSRTPASTAALATEVGAAVYDNVDRFLAHRPMDVIAIGTPSGLHAEQGIAAARAGLHAIVEKPLDISTARIDALIAEADLAAVTVGVCFQDRVAPDLVAVKRFVDAGRLGRPVMASGRVKWRRDAAYYTQSSWRGTRALDGGGALMNQGIHTVDVLQWLFGPVARVRARVATRVHEIEVEDTAAAVLEFASGALGTIEASTAVSPGYPRRVELVGTEGTLIIEDSRLIGVDVRDPGDLHVSTAAIGTSATSPAVPDITPHRRLFEDFIDAIERRRAPACDAREGRRSVAVVEAIYESSRRARAVDVAQGSSAEVRQ